MRAVKITVSLVGALFALIVALLVAVWLFVNPNDYKERIAAEVKSSTGRELLLPGDIKLSIFPWLALELGPASLGNLPGFGSEPFASVQHASLRVRLLPLLHKQLEVGQVEVTGLDLRLKKNAAGRGNWQSPETPATPASPSSGSSSSSLPDLAGVSIDQSRIAYQDMVASDVHLEVGHVTARSAIPVKLELSLTTAKDRPPMKFSGKLQATLDPQSKQYHVADLDLAGTVSALSGAGMVNWSFSAPAVDADLDRQTLSVAQFAATLAGAKLSGQLSGTDIEDAPTWKGKIGLDPLSLRDWMSSLGMTPPTTRDSRALTRFALAAAFDYGKNAARLTDLKAQLDDSTLTGSATIADLDTLASSFSLKLDQIDLDRYRSPPEPNAKNGEANTGAQSVNSKSKPTDALKTLQLQGTASIGTAKVSNVTLTQVAVTLDISHGLAHIAPIKARVYGGDYSGDITVDTRPSTPTFKVDQAMTAIDVKPLLTDFAKFTRLSGHGTVTTNLTGSGDDSDAILKSLNGKVNVNLADGALQGMDLWFEVNRAVSLLQKQGLPQGSDSGSTKFDAFKVSADVVNGVASSKDLTITSQNLHVTGQGTSNLSTQAIDYQVKATLLKSAAANAGTLADVPVLIGGTFSDPKVRPDVEGLAKARLQQEIDKHKGELQQKLQDQLKGLFH